MAWREVTPEGKALGELFRRHINHTFPATKKGPLAARAGVSTSVLNNIEKGRLVSLRSYLTAAEGLGLPGGADRVETIFNGGPDPGAGLTVSQPRAFHPAADAETAQAGRLAELILRFETLLATQNDQLAALADRVADLERTNPQPRRKRSSAP